MIWKCSDLPKKEFFTGVAFLSALRSVNLLSGTPRSATLRSYISMNNQECKVRPQIVNLNSNEPVFFPFSIKTIKCSGSCNYQ